MFLVFFVVLSLAPRVLNRCRRGVFFFCFVFLISFFHFILLILLFGAVHFHCVYGTRTHTPNRVFQMNNVTYTQSGI